MHLPTNSVHHECFRGTESSNWSKWAETEWKPRPVSISWQNTFGRGSFCDPQWQLSSSSLLLPRSCLCHGSTHWNIRYIMCSWAKKRASTYQEIFFLCSLHVHPCMHKHTIASVGAINGGRWWATREHCYPRWETESGEREWTVECRGTESLGTSIMLHHQVLCSLSDSINFHSWDFPLFSLNPACQWAQVNGKNPFFSILFLVPCYCIRSLACIWKQWNSLKKSQIYLGY